MNKLANLAEFSGTGTKNLYVSATGRTVELQIETATDVWQTMRVFQQTEIEPVQIQLESGVTWRVVYQPNDTESAVYEA